LAIGTPSDGTVTNAKIVDGAVTTAKIADANITTAKVANNAVTYAKLATDIQGSFIGFKNRIINGAQVINQRAASVTSAGTYVTDRFQWDTNTTTATLTFAQSTVAPTGFTNSLGITVGTADTSIAAGDLIDFRHWIEGNNVADFGLGTASAVTFTVSFWVRSSIVGTYGASFRNSDASRVYVSTFTINVANTWEQKTITVAGDTSGTWLTDTGRGLGMNICLTSGTTYQTTAGVWTGAGNFRTTSAQANLVGTSGATFYITGVQLEKGTQATSFDFRSIGTELLLCQRYCRTVLSAETSGFGFVNGSANFFMFDYGTPMRSTPSLSYSGTLNPTNYSSNISTVTGVNAISTTANSGGVRTAFALNSSPSPQACALNPNGNLVLITSEL
jgi:hypothetical protein